MLEEPRLAPLCGMRKYFGVENLQEGHFAEVNEQILSAPRRRTRFLRVAVEATPARHIQNRRSWGCVVKRQLLCVHGDAPQLFWEQNCHTRKASGVGRYDTSNLVRWSVQYSQFLSFRVLPVWFGALLIVLGLLNLARIGKPKSVTVGNGVLILCYTWGSTEQSRKQSAERSGVRWSSILSKSGSFWCRVFGVPHCRNTVEIR